MEKINYVIVLLVALIVFVSLVLVGIVETIKEIRALRKLLKCDLDAHQTWLFNQLYSLWPGRILKPDELEPEVKSEKAIVINRARDPMNEFNGQRDDWHGKQY